jgi:hypothetical protein
MITISITETGRSYGKNEKFKIFNEYEKKGFESIEQALSWLKGNYEKSSWKNKRPCFVDTDSGTKQVGFVIGFRNADLSHYPVNKWIQQDWVSFNEEKGIFLNERKERQQ